MRTRTHPFPASFGNGIAIVLSLAVVFACTVAIPFGRLVPSWLAEQQARALPLPLYPDSYLAQTLTSVSGDMKTETRVYIAPGDMVVVGSWMERRFPGFQMCAGSLHPDCWTNDRCNQSLISTAVTQLVYLSNDNQHTPCMHVRLQSNGYGAPSTVIFVELTWPKQDASD